MSFTETPLKWLPEVEERKQGLELKQRNHQHGPKLEIPQLKYDVLIISTNQKHATRLSKAKNQIWESK